MNKWTIGFRSLALVLFLYVASGCTGKLPAQPPTPGMSESGATPIPNPTPIASPASPSASIELQSQLFAQNVVAAMDQRGATSVAARVLAISVCTRSERGACGADNGVEALEKLGDAAILRGASQLLADSRETPIVSLDLHAALVGAEDFSALSVVEAVHAYRSDRLKLGRTEGSARFDAKMRVWAPRILPAVQRQYVRSNDNRYRQAIDEVLARQLDAQQDASLRPDSGVRELVRGLPTSLESMRAIRELSLDPTFDPRELTSGESTELSLRLSRLAARDLAELRDSLRSPVSGATARTEKLLNRRFEQVDTAVTLTGMFIDRVLGKPAEARKFETVARNGLRIAKAASQIKFGSIAANIASMNVIGAATEILGGLSSILGIDGPDADTQRHEQVMSALGDIRRDIADLNEEMNHRFDQVDHRLLEISQQLERGFGELGRQNEELGQKINDLQKTVNLLLERVNDLSYANHQGFKDLFEHLRGQDFQRCLGPNSLTVVRPESVSEQTVADCLSSFYHLAQETAYLDTRSGRGTHLSSADAMLIALDRSDAQPAVLREMLAELRLGLTAEQLGSAPAVNLEDWASGVDAYLRMRLKFPRVAAAASTDQATVGELVRSGLEIERSLMRIGSPESLARMIREYELVLDRLLDPSIDASKDPERMARLDVLRRLVDQVILASHAGDRLRNGQIGIALGTDSYSLPSSRDIVAMRQLAGAADRDRELGHLIRRRNRGVSFLSDYAYQLQSVGALEGPNTVISRVLRRLELYQGSIGGRN